MYMAYSSIVGKHTSKQTDRIILSFLNSDDYINGTEG